MLDCRDLKNIKTILLAKCQNQRFERFVIYRTLLLPSNNIADSEIALDKNTLEYKFIDCYTKWFDKHKYSGALQSHIQSIVKLENRQLKLAFLQVLQADFARYATHFKPYQLIKLMFSGTKDLKTALAGSNQNLSFHNLIGPAIQEMQLDAPFGTQHNSSIFACFVLPGLCAPSSNLPKIYDT